MEGIVLGPEVFGSVSTFLGAVALLAIVVAISLLGYMAEKEKTGTRLFWAEWPLPEEEAGAPEETEYLKAA